MEDIYKDLLDNYIEEIDKLDQQVRNKGYQNTQWFINAMDKLNEISVR